MPKDKPITLMVGLQVAWEKFRNRDEYTRRRNKGVMSFGIVRAVRDDGYATIAAEPDGRILMIPVEDLMSPDDAKDYEPKPQGRPMPPGLVEFALADDIPDSVTMRLSEAWYTIRGKRPTTVDEWRTLYEPLKDVFSDKENQPNAD